ncbi:MAG: hypothetical protein Q9192_002321 [Flavoplaca navasiana]
MKRPKLCKDEATFVKGKPQIEVNYWPCEFQDEKAAAEHRKYKVYPFGEIAEYCKHVPYRSEKKTFLSKTGREGFHVFQYTFQMTHDDKRHTVMWDYNIGLVRITPFFKALEYPKTTPARMLGRNPGLKEICHSITGGSLAAQGYWMPFEAAKAVAATFCYRIRYVLTPIFGLDFPEQCISPGSLGFDSMQVEPVVVRKCIQAAQIGHGLCLGPQLKSRPETPSSEGGRSWTAANIQPKHLKLDSESGYGTDTDGSDSYVYSPQKPARHRIKRATPRSSGTSAPYEQSYVSAYAPSQTGSESDFSNECRKRKRKPARSTNEEEDDSSSDSSESAFARSTPEKTEEATGAPSVAKEMAAKALLELKMEARVFERPLGQGSVKEWRRASA